MINELFVLHTRKDFDKMETFFNAHGYKTINEIKGI